MKVLLLEDDPILSREIHNYLISLGFTCDAVYDGQLFFMEATRNKYDIFLLDINVPKINGLEVCRRIRETDLNTPILMLTAYGDISDKKEAFQLGADDYLVKPFHFDELQLRMNSLMRRGKHPQQSAGAVLTIDDLEINTEDKTAKRGGEPINLTPKEYQLLLLLAQANGRTLSKQTIADKIWDLHFDPNLNTIEVYINFLRKKIDRGHQNKLIHTRPGFGYFLKPTENDA